MSLEAEEVRVAGTGHIYVAPVDTAFPTSITAAVSHAAGWRELGYATKEGARFAFGREVNSIMGWQSFDPLRKIITALPKTVAFDLMQTNQNTWALGMGGGTFTEPSAGEYEYEPPDEDYVDHRALIVEMSDGDYDYRLCFRKALNENGVDFAFVRTDPLVFPITMGILAADGGLKPFLVQTNDPNFGELVEAGS